MDSWLSVGKVRSTSALAVNGGLWGNGDISTASEAGVREDDETGKLLPHVLLCHITVQKDPSLLQ